MEQRKNKWLIALAAIGIHISIGSVYAWSVLTNPIMEAMNSSLKSTTWVFSIAILFLGLSAGFLGSYVEKMGPVVAVLLLCSFSVVVCLVLLWRLNYRASYLCISAMALSVVSV